jgi:hypothetical protein
MGDRAREPREHLQVLGSRLLALHAVLLRGERQAYEERHGPTKAAELLRLVISDEHFAWLRSLSAIIAQIDEALDPREPPPEVDVESFFRGAQELLRSGGSGAFQTKYRDALQRSHEVVMAHAEVVKVLPKPSAG